MSVAKKRVRKTPPPEPLRIQGLALTAEDSEALRGLSSTISDHVGRKVSSSAILRAMIHLADTDAIPLATLVGAIETEMNSGRKWGRTPRQKKS
jgi:hypothetical protein